MDSKILGNRVKLLMSYKKIKVTELASKLEISYKTLMKKLNGETEFCNLDIIKLQRIFDLNIEMFSNIFFNPEFNLEEKLNNKKKIS